MMSAIEVLEYCEEQIEELQNELETIHKQAISGGSISNTARELAMESNKQLGFFQTVKDVFEELERTGAYFVIEDLDLQLAEELDA